MFFVSFFLYILVHTLNLMELRHQRVLSSPLLAPQWQWINELSRKNVSPFHSLRQADGWMPMKTAWLTQPSRHKNKLRQTPTISKSNHTNSTNCFGRVPFRAGWPWWEVQPNITEVRMQQGLEHLLRQSFRGWGDWSYIPRLTNNKHTVLDWCGPIGMEDRSSKHEYDKPKIEEHQHMLRA